VGDNEIGNDKNEGESLAMSIAMAMQWYDVGRISQESTPRASLEVTGCLHWASACAVSPWRLPLSTNLLKQHKTLPKHNF
jgi:hypothetical protein